MNETPTGGEKVVAALLYLCTAVLVIQLFVRPLLALLA
jgi:hypothetical protein